MDPKKQELNPELKEIYDRVMNTQVKSENQPQSVPTEQPPTAPQAPAVSPPPAAATSQDPFLSSAPPRPMIDTKPFVFTGNKVTTSEAPHATQLQTTLRSSGKLSWPIIAVLIAVLIVVWALFWAKFFGLI